MSILTFLFLGPQRRRNLKEVVQEKKRALVRIYRRARNRFDAVFGVNGALAFFLSVLFALLTLLVSLYWFGSVAFLWLGSWSWITRPVGWLWGIVSQAGGVMRGALYRIPGVGYLFGFVSVVWKQYIVPRVPSVEAHRKRAVYNSLRAARYSRMHSMRVHQRFVRRQKRRKQRKEEARILKRARLQAEEMKRQRILIRKNQFQRVRSHYLQHFW